MTSHKRRDFVEEHIRGMTFDGSHGTAGRFIRRERVINGKSYRFERHVYNANNNGRRITTIQAWHNSPDGWRSVHYWSDQKGYEL